MPASGPGRPRRGRLSRSGDFKRAYREGSSKANRYLILYRFEREDDDTGTARLGVSVSRKVGDAVTRNKVKRVLKEAFWRVMPEGGGREDFVLVARPGVEELIHDQGLAGAEAAVLEVSGGGDRST